MILYTKPLYHFTWEVWAYVHHPAAAAFLGSYNSVCQLASQLISQDFHDQVKLKLLLSLVGFHLISLFPLIPSTGSAGSNSA